LDYLNSPYFSLVDQLTLVYCFKIGNFKIRISLLIILNYIIITIIFHIIQRFNYSFHEHFMKITVVFVHIHCWLLFLVNTNLMKIDFCHSKNLLSLYNFCHWLHLPFLSFLILSRKLSWDLNLTGNFWEKINYPQIILSN